MKRFLGIKALAISSILALSGCVAIDQIQLAGTNVLYFDAPETQKYIRAYGKSPIDILNRDEVFATYVSAFQSAPVKQSTDRVILDDILKNTPLEENHDISKLLRDGETAKKMTRCRISLIFNASHDLVGLFGSNSVSFSGCREVLENLAFLKENGYTKQEKNRREQAIKAESERKARAEEQASIENQCKNYKPSATYKNVRFSSDDLASAALGYWVPKPQKNMAYRANELIKVMQVLYNGVLAQIEGTSTIIFLDTKNKMVDGERFHDGWFVYRGETLSYTTVFGAKKTVYRFRSVPTSVSDKRDCLRFYQTKNGIP